MWLRSHPRRGGYAAGAVDATMRPARPDRHDGESFAELFEMASDGLLRWMFGSRFVGIVSEAFCEPGHDMSFEHTSFAEVDAGVAGMVSGYSSAAHEQSTSGPLVRAAGIRAVRMFGAWTVARRLFDFMDQQPVGDWYIQAVAVDPAHRGSGIGSMMLDHAEGLAVGEGAQRLTLDVAVENEAARRLYERRGMTVEATSPSVAALGGLAVHRMAKAL